MAEIKLSDGSVIKTEASYDGLQVAQCKKGDELDFGVAQAEVAVATALRLTLEFQACLSVADDDMPRPPYARGQSEPWTRIQFALDEVRRYALEEAAGHPADASNSRSAHCGQ